MKLQSTIAMFTGAATLMVLIWFPWEGSRVSLSPSHASEFTPSIPAPLPLIGNKSTLDQRASSSNAATELLRQSTLESPAVQSFIQEVKQMELSSARYLNSHRSRGRQLVVLLPAVSRKDLARISSRIDTLIDNVDGSADTQTKARVREELLAWLHLNEHETVLIIDFVNDEPSGREIVNGRWLEIESSAEIRDEFQYMDYGKVLRGDALSEATISDRFGHLFRVSDGE